MAKNGQIKGAKLIGNSWTFPENSEKPADGRLKKDNSIPPFHFPNLFYKRIDRNEMNKDELELYNYEIEFHKMIIEQAVISLEGLYAKTILSSSFNLLAISFDSIIPSLGMLLIDYIHLITFLFFRICSTLLV